MAPVPAVNAAEDSLPYVRDYEVGSGSFANVYKGHHQATGLIVAVKMVPRYRLNNAKLVKHAVREAEILKSINHPHITSLIDIIEKEKNMFLIMEFCFGGDLSDYRRKRGKVEGLEYIPDVGMMPTYYPHPQRGGLAYVAVRSFITQLMEAMKFLHSRDLVHRDLKPSNIMLTLANDQDLLNGHPAGIPILKVADFGFARLLPGIDMTDTICGSPLYMAPEVLVAGRPSYGSKADLWSVGCIIYELSFGEVPYPAHNHVELNEAHKARDGVQIVEYGVVRFRRDVPADIRDLCSILLQHDSMKRASHQTVFAHECLPISATAATVTSLAERGKNLALMQKLAETHKTAYEALSRKHRPLKRPKDVLPDPEEEPEPVKPLPRDPKRLTSREGSEKLLRAETNVGIVPRRPAPRVPSSKSSNAVPGSSRPKAPRQEPKVIKAFDFQQLGSDELERDFVMVEETKAIVINKVADELQQARDAAKNGSSAPDRVDMKGGFKSWHIPDFHVDPSTPGQPRRKKNYIFYPEQANDMKTDYPRWQRQPKTPPAQHEFPPAPIEPEAPVVTPPESPVTPAKEVRVSTLSRAIQAASIKLFGTPTNVRPNTANASPPLKRQHILKKGDPIPVEEKELLRKLEDLSQKAHVLNEFANSKHKLAQVKPCTKHRHGPTLGEAYFPAHPYDHQLTEAPSWQCGKGAEEVERIKVAAGEALQLYMRVMMFAQKALDLTIDFTREKEIKGDTTPPSGTFNGAVQWFRHVFNRARTRCLAMKEVAGEQTVKRPDLLIYDQALELARDGGAKETQADAWFIAEEEYETALLLLCALFDEVFQDENPAQMADRYTLDIYMNLIKVRIAKTRRCIDEHERNMEAPASDAAPAEWPASSPADVTATVPDTARAPARDSIEAAPHLTPAVQT